MIGRSPPSWPGSPQCRRSHPAAEVADHPRPGWRAGQPGIAVALVLLGQIVQKLA
jgi:hypothetical protein